MPEHRHRAAEFRPRSITGHSVQVRNLALTWQQAAVLAAALFGVAIVCRVLGGPRVRAVTPFARESGIIAALYSMWQLAGTVSVVDVSGAFARGRWIIRFERAVHLPSETDLQHLVEPHRTVAELCNLYYAGMHFAGLGALLLWLFVRHRDQYARVRTTIVLLTGACLLIQLLPVAPPRLFPQYGFVDLADRYGQSVYAAFPTADQLSAMPSVHVGWAVLVGWAVVTISPSRWRWLVLAHPIVTIFVVVATGNHFWLDGIVAVGLLILAELARRAASSVLRRLRAAPVTESFVAV